MPCGSRAAVRTIEDIRLDKLLPHYERELAFLREQSQAFAQRYPKVAGALQLRGDTAQDPHVERMIESFALLAARVHKRLDDDFPLFTESLLEVLYPHYLRPFPACSIAHFDLGPAAAQMSKPVTVARGTALQSRPVKGVPCRFRTTQPVRLTPVRLSGVAYRNAVSAPEGTRLPPGATSLLSLTLTLDAPQMRWADALGPALRLYLDGEPSQVSVLRETLCRHAVAVMVQSQPHLPWRAVTRLDAGGFALPQLAGFADDEALLDLDARSHEAYRLLTEYFAFPEKFNFVDLPLGALADGIDGIGADGQSADGRSAARTLTLQILVAGVRGDSDESRLLEGLHARNLVLGCTPVINLFQQPAEPIRVTHAADSYPVLVDARRPYAHEVHTIDRVFRVVQTAHGESVQTFKPFFSLSHDDLVAAGDAAPLPTWAAGQTSGQSVSQGSGHREDGRAAGATSGLGAAGRYWAASRDEAVAEMSPGHELSLSLVDLQFDPVAPQTETLSIMVTASNRDLPGLLPFGVAGGDLFMEGGAPAREIRLLRKPTPSMRFARGQGALWRLISHLSLNHLSLSGGGLEALKEMLRLYDLPRSVTNRRQIDGLVDVAFQPAVAWLPGEPYATFVRGTEVRLTVDESHFVGSGLSVFAAMLDRFFGLYAHINSFSQLTLVSARTQEEVLACPPRNGDMPLV
jgi:type VI secretion system protein ImpG